MNLTRLSRFDKVRPFAQKQGEWSPGKGRRGLCTGMTIPEMLITLTIFSFVIIGVISIELFIMKSDQLVSSKIGATDMSRVSFNDLTRDIRSAKIWAIGNGSVSTFTPIPNGTAQHGNALQVSLSADTNSFIRYFFDTNACTLSRFTNGMSSATVLAQNLTNTMYFQAENYAGSTVSDLQYKYIIHVIMQFCQFQYPLTHIGPGYYYNYYRIDLRMSPHCPDGA